MRSARRLRSGRPARLAAASRALASSSTRISAAMPATVHEKLLETAGRFPEQDLLVYPGWLAERWQLPRASWTYGAVASITERLAARYREAGYGPGQRVALLLENRPEHFFHWLA